MEDSDRKWQEGVKQNEYFIYDDSEGAQGVCLKCKSRNLEYGDVDWGDGFFWYEVCCKDCGLDFREVYIIEFLQTEVDHEPSC